MTRHHDRRIEASHEVRYQDTTEYKPECGDTDTSEEGRFWFGFFVLVAGRFVDGFLVAADGAC